MVPVVVSLLKRDVDCDRLCNGLTALYVAAERGHNEICWVLVNDRVDNGNLCNRVSPLSRAQANGHTQVCSVL